MKLIVTGAILFSLLGNPGTATGRVNGITHDRMNVGQVSVVTVHAHTDMELRNGMCVKVNGEWNDDELWADSITASDDCEPFTVKLPIIGS